MANIVRDKYSMFTVIYSIGYVYKEGRFERSLRKSRHAYSIQFLLLYSLQDCKEKENDKVCLVRMNYN